MVKLSDYVIDFLVRKKISDIFMISGGGIIHLVESAGNNKAINYFCNYNEQATTYCAEGYARLKNNVSVSLVTTGPGSTNAISGVASAWVDSVPVVVISGQVKRELIADYTKLRQIGEQEINIIDIVRPITKYAVTVDSAKMIKYELEKAFYTAVNNRPGPVWINIPLDVQGSFINEKDLVSFKTEARDPARKKRYLKSKVKKAVDILKKSKRPVMICGYGIRLAGAEKLLSETLKSIHIPVLLSFNGMDLLPENHFLFTGKPGIIGQRRANFALQNSDCVLSVGSRLNIKIVGYDYKNVALKAKKIIVDIDKEELKKPTISADLPIEADAKDFLEELLKQVKKEKLDVPENWIEACKKWKKRYPGITPEFLKDRKHVNTYVFYDRLSKLSSRQDVILSGNALSALCLYQAFKVKEKQRVFTNNGYGAMGWDLPASIGACIANNKKRTICVTGDGSINMNIQELMMVRHYNLPVKIFIFNNSGYTSIRLTQDTFFKGHYVGSDANSGVSNPNFQKIAHAYNLPYEKISNNNELDEKIKKVLSSDGPVFCELNVSPAQGVVPKTTSYKKEDGSFESRPLEDMFPFLSREELRENMRISEDD
ncbi:MAG: thiamine pyrophosphate-binding protein [bacterium]